MTPFLFRITIRTDGCGRGVEVLIQARNVACAIDGLNSVTNRCYRQQDFTLVENNTYEEK